MRLKYVVVIASGLLSLTATSQPKQVRNDGKITILFLQLNDVYEISPLDRGKTGGMARVAMVRKELLKYNPNTFTVLAGDFLSPSAIGTILYDTQTKKPTGGLQMVEAMDAAGFNLVTFGNHEFDFRNQDQLTMAINQSSFDWISSNVKYKDSTGIKEFSKQKNGKTVPVPVTQILSFKDADGTQVKIGVFGLTIETTGINRFEVYEDYYAAAASAIKELKEKKCDFIVVITHLEIGMDKKLAQLFPEIKLILGGHEHVNSYDTIGNTIIAKADANARSAYIHSLFYDTRSKKLSIKSHLLVINNAIEEDAATSRVVDKWNNLAQELLKKQGFEPCEILDSLTTPLDGRELVIRTEQTELGELIGMSMMEALADHTDCAIFNSGSIRIDDMLKGYITQYDIFRVLPFESQIVIKQLPGSFIDSLLKSNYKREKDGSFLQYAGIEKKDTSYYINGKLLYKDPGLYKVAMSSFLAAGRQSGLEIIKSLQPEADTKPRLTIPENDMRKALIAKFKKKTAASSKVWPANNLKIPCY